MVQYIFGYYLPLFLAVTHQIRIKGIILFVQHAIYYIANIAWPNVFRGDSRTHGLR